MSTSDALLRTAYLLCGDHSRAEDLLQTAFWNTYRAWPRIRDELRRERYVRRCLINAYFGWHRKSSSSEKPGDVSSRSVPDLAEAFAERDLVLRALDSLPARQRAVLILRYFEDMSEVQVARTLRCSVGTVKSQAHHALARLRDLPGLERPGSEVARGRER